MSDPLTLLAVLEITAVLALAVTVVSITATWKVFTKAGCHGWTALVPFYNAAALCQIALRSPAWSALVILPIVINSYTSVFASASSDAAAVITVAAQALLSACCTVVYSVVIGTGLAIAFDRSTLFGVLCGLLPIVGFCILGFGKARYLAAPHPTPHDQAGQFA
jgi:hypothetical protein